MVTSVSVRGRGGGGQNPKETLVSLLVVQKEQKENFYISVVSRAIKLKADKGNSRLDDCEVRTSLFATNSCTLLSLPYSIGAVYHKDNTDRPGTPWTQDCSKYLYPFISLQLLVPENFTSVEEGRGGGTDGWTDGRKAGCNSALVPYTVGSVLRTGWVLKFIFRIASRNV